MLHEREAAIGEALASALEAMLPRRFRLDSGEVIVLGLSRDRLASIVDQAPRGFSQEPEVYKYDVAFLKGITGDDVMSQVRANPDVDAVWATPDAFYYRRLASKLRQSRMSRLIGTPVYKYMTIRNWSSWPRWTSLRSDGLRDQASASLSPSSFSAPRNWRRYPIG